VQLITALEYPLLFHTFVLCLCFTFQRVKYDMDGTIFWIPVGRKCLYTATAGVRVKRRQLDARICCSPVTKLCKFQCGVAQVCTIPSAGALV